MSMAVVMALRVVVETQRVPSPEPLPLLVAAIFVMPLGEADFFFDTLTHGGGGGVNGGCRSTTT